MSVTRWGAFFFLSKAWLWRLENLPNRGRRASTLAMCFVSFRNFLFPEARDRKKVKMEIIAVLVRARFNHKSDSGIFILWQSKTIVDSTLQLKIALLPHVCFHDGCCSQRKGAGNIGTTWLCCGHLQRSCCSQAGSHSPLQQSVLPGIVCWGKSAENHLNPNHLSNHLHGRCLRPRRTLRRQKDLRRRPPFLFTWPQRSITTCTHSSPSSEHARNSQS